jgi:hypothetical protein
LDFGLKKGKGEGEKEKGKNIPTFSPSPTGFHPNENRYNPPHSLLKL